MNNKGLIVLCIVAIVALVGWLAALAGRETIEDLTKEIKFLKSENARLEKVASKEPSTIEALAALQAKCRRQDINECSQDCKDPVLKRFCVKCMVGVPEEIHKAYDKAFCEGIGNEIEAKTKEYMEDQS